MGCTIPPCPGFEARSAGRRSGSLGSTAPTRTARSSAPRVRWSPGLTTRTRQHRVNICKTFAKKLQKNRKNREKSRKTCEKIRKMTKHREKKAKHDQTPRQISQQWRKSRKIMRNPEKSRKIPKNSQKSQKNREKSRKFLTQAPPGFDPASWDSLSCPPRCPSSCNTTTHRSYHQHLIHL